MLGKLGESLFDVESIYYLLQSFDRPGITQLKGCRIDVLSFMAVTVDGEEKVWVGGVRERYYGHTKVENNQPSIFFGILCLPLEVTRRLDR